MKFLTRRFISEYDPNLGKYHFSFLLLYPTWISPVRRYVCVPTHTHRHTHTHEVVGPGLVKTAHLGAERRSGRMTQPMGQNVLSSRNTPLHRAPQTTCGWPN